MVNAIVKRELAQRQHGAALTGGRFAYMDPIRQTPVHVQRSGRRQTHMRLVRDSELQTS